MIFKPAHCIWIGSVQRPIQINGCIMPPTSNSNSNYSEHSIDCKITYGEISTNYQYMKDFSMRRTFKLLK